MKRRVSPSEKPEFPAVQTEGEIFVGCKDAGAIEPEAYWTYAEDPIVPEDTGTERGSRKRSRWVGGEKIPSAAKGVEKSRLGSRYEILCAEGKKGGMGIVYPARHKKLDMKVAIKALLPGHSKERFLKEAQLLAKVRSPHVVSIHDFLVLPGGVPIIVMDWIDGLDLAQIMEFRGGRVDEQAALPWMWHTSEGMQAAAVKGIVHRDLKPCNIMIDNIGNAQVTDFGLARGISGDSSLSRPGSLIGTVYYMAPEQAKDS